MHDSVFSLPLLREFNIASTFLRLFIAVGFGGVIGFEREKHGRTAGMRTYILITIGAALTMMPDQYYAEMISSV